ncbi:tyrosine-type recombinase/integrase [Herminiimonas sp. CN]|uniref:tyrosine-type recombinase/integrase n=1 Tax=Herminiimonas sp. CN TaxID=1349818 RepID=UPI000473F4F0|nr:tyrosine-type recombinase/integrase [Herminiimonas sp. CN]
MLHRYLTSDEQQRLIKAAQQPSDILARRDAAWLNALLLSGLRITEFSLITLGDVHEALQHKYLFIPKERRKGGKTDHRVFVTAPLRAALKTLIDVHLEMVGKDWSPVDAPLVVSRQHDGCRAMSVRSFQMRFKHWAAIAGLPPDASPHWLRHSRAMNIMRNSEAADPRGIAKEALGHASIASTGVYTGVLREELEQALTQTDATKAKRVSLVALRKDFDKRS